jgi:hypothetical protein
VKFVDGRGGELEEDGNAFADIVGGLWCAYLEGWVGWVGGEIGGVAGEEVGGGLEREG